jgi:hypothetical protein
MVHYHFDDDANSTEVSGGEEGLEIFECAVTGVDGGVIGYVVTIVAEWGGIKGEKPDGGDPEFVEIV